MIELSYEIKTFLMGMTPLGGERLAIPVALTVYGLSPLSAYFISIAGNLTSVLLILTFLGVTSRWLSKHSYYFNRLFAVLFAKTKRDHSAQVNQKYGLYALAAFIALPFPMSGGWTASLIAFVFDIPFKKAFPAIAIGTMIAGLVILFATNAGVAINKYLGWQTLLGTIIVGGIGYFLYKRIVSRIKK